MSYWEAEYEKLLFLTQYNFKVYNYSTGRYAAICMITDECCITYHEWPQFGDFNIIITKNLEDLKHYKFQQVYRYQWLINNIYDKYKKAHNCKWWSNIKHIDLFVFYLHDQIENHKNIFGVPIDQV